MSSKEKSHQDFGSRLEDVIQNDVGVDKASRFFWEEARKDAESFPTSYLLLTHTRLRLLSRKLGESTVTLIHANNCRTEKGSSGEVRSEMQRCKTDPLIRTHLSKISNAESIENLDLIERDGLVQETEKRLLRDTAISTVWESSANVAWQSAAVDMQMPPFEPEEERFEKVENIARRLNESKSRFSASLMRLISILEEIEEIPPTPVAKLLEIESKDYLDKLKNDNKEKSSSIRNRFIRIADRSENKLKERGMHFLNLLLDRRNARLLDSLRLHFSLESLALSKLLDTDFGAEWKIDEGGYDNKDFRTTLRKDMEDLFLTIGCYQDVLEALNKEGDPKRARIRIAPKTARRASEDQKEHLKTAFKTLKTESGLNHATRDDWKEALTDESTKGEAKINGVERLACSCLNVDKKGQLPARYKGFEDGGFATLVQDLYHGMWQST